MGDKDFDFDGYNAAVLDPLRARLTSPLLREQVNRFGGSVETPAGGEARESYVMYRLQKVVRVPLGLFGGLVMPGQESTLESLTLQQPFRPTHLVLDPASADNFVLCAFKVGHVHQTPTGGPLPLTAFSVAHRPSAELSDLLRWKGDSASPGMRIALTVKNRPTGSMARAFEGLLWGVAIV